MKRVGAHTGLGDRLGGYLTSAMIGEIIKKDIYTTWVLNSVRGGEYPENILDYINFPSRLKFVSEEEFKLLDKPELNFTVFYHGFDYIPESIYKSLIKDKIIKCSFEEMMNTYRKVSKELFYKKNLQIENNLRPGIIHLRRGDKGNNIDHNERILKLVEKINTKNWVIISDSEIPPILLNNVPFLLEPKWSSDPKVKTLEQFFFCSNCSIIIQSVNYQNEIGSEWSGWCGFSYVAFQLGLAKYVDNPPKLISCNLDKDNTRFTYARKYTGIDLFNVFMYNNFC
jgi:hypothetical protein